MLMRALPLYAVAFALLAAPAWARNPKLDAPEPKPIKADPPPVMQPPKNCADQCKLVQKVCEDPCTKIKGKPDAQRACKANCQQFTSACNGSCQAHGYIDKEYMVKRIRPPGGKAPAEGAAQGAEGGGEKKEPTPKIIEVQP